MIRKISELNHKKILITGGCGFIGGHLTNILLKQGADITIIDNLTTSAIKENINKFKQLGILHEIDINELSSDNNLFQNIDCVFHLAAENIPSVCEKKPIESFNTNINGTFKVAQLCYANSIKKLIFTSSAYVYSQPPQYMPIDEKHPVSSSQSFYGSLKLLAENLIWVQRLKYPLTSVGIARMFNVYGPKQKDSYIIPKLVNQCINNTIDTIELFEGESTRDFMYIEDLVEGLILLANHTGSVGPINFGRGAQITINELVNIVISLTTRKKIQYTKPESRRTYMLANNMLAYHSLGWKPQIDLHQGLKEIINTL